jgi:hypothetical protein
MKELSFSTTPISRSRASVNDSSEKLGSNPSLRSPPLPDASQAPIPQAITLPHNEVNSPQKTPSIKKLPVAVDIRSVGISGPVINNGNFILNQDAAAAMSPLTKSNIAQDAIVSAAAS